MKKFIFSKFPGSQAYRRELYYQMNSFTGIFRQHFKPPMLPHQILKCPHMFSTPVTNPDKYTIQPSMEYCCHVWAGALKRCHFGVVFKPLYPVFPHRHRDSKNMFCAKNLKMITTSLNSNFSIIWIWRVNLIYSFIFVCGISRRYSLKKVFSKIWQNSQ